MVDDLVLAESRKVWFFVPNLIGYTRVIAALVAFYWHAAGDRFLFFLWYALSYGLDAVDGVAARWLHQESTFGMVLDMVTDRVCTNVLLMILGVTYQEKWGPWAFLAFTCLAVLDITSHWVRTVASLQSGQSSHKTMSEDRPALLQLYYGSRVVLFFLCAGNEACLALLYLGAYTGGPQVLVPASLAQPFLTSPVPKGGIQLGIVSVGAVITFPIFAVKQLISIIQLVDSLGEIALMDGHKRAHEKTE